VVITSNSEKSLPEPFLRRCVYYHIPSPDPVQRREIVWRREAPFSRRTILFPEAMALFDRVREQLGRAPGTAELLAWLDVLEDRVRFVEAEKGAPLASIHQDSRILDNSFVVIAKTKEDLECANAEISSVLAVAAS
jgi:MoxR-like ATPase